MNELERTGKLDRSLEFLPNEKSLIEHKLMGKGLSSPAIAVLHCYSKIILKEALLASDVPEDPYLKTFLVSSFPKPLQNKFSEQMQEHPLKREIIATKLSNIIVNDMGFSFVYRMQDETGAPISAIARAYMITRSVLDMEMVWKKIEALDSVLDAQDQVRIMLLYVRLLRRITRWFLRNQRMRLDITTAVKQYTTGMQEFKKILPTVFGEDYLSQYNEKLEKYLLMGVPEDLAQELMMTPGLFSAMDILEVSQKFSVSVREVAEIYFKMGDFLHLTWIRTQVIIHSTENHWEALSREALRDDLDWQQRKLTSGIIKSAKKNKDYEQAFLMWSEHHVGLIERWRHILASLRSSTTLNYTMFFVAIRDLLDLTQTTTQASEKLKVASDD
jgi:glutamate dehydrogenase